MATKKIPRAEMSEEERERKRAIGRAHYARNRERINAASRALRATKTDLAHERYLADKAANPEKYLRYGRTWRAKNPERVRELAKRWRLKNKARLAEQDRARYLRDSERHRQWMRAWTAKNREYVRARQREWDQRNPDKAKARHARKRANKANAPINDFTPEQWEALCAVVKYRCCYCGAKGTAETLQPDHLTPYNDKGSNTLHNILPCCGPCNYRKKDRAVLKPVQPFLLIDEGAAD